MENGKNRSPYKGFIVACTFLILVSLALFGFVYSQIVKYDRTMTSDLQLYSSMMFAFGVVSIFDLSCILVGGALKEDFKAIVKRVGHFLSNVFVSPKIAFMCYKSELKEDGAAFWGYIVIMGIHFTLFVIGFRECFDFYVNFL